MNKLECFGGCREVGRSAYMLKTGTENILFDYGVKLTSDDDANDGPELPIRPDIDIDGVLLSHCHLDHSGLIPALYSRGYNGNVYSTAITFDLAEILLRDSVKIAKMEGYQRHFFNDDVNKMINNKKIVTFGQNFDIGESEITAFKAGHIPGSCSFYVDTGDQTIMYSGDINQTKTKLTKQIESEYPDVDVLITETTYADEEHPPREELENKLIQKIKERLLKDGNVIIPSFAIGRSQEMIMLLNEADIDVPIYLDGMGVDATRKILRYPEYLRSPDKLKQAFDNVRTISNNEDRREAVSKPSVIVTTSGMLAGGPIVYYMKKLHANRNCSFFLTGYQVEGTPGRKLLDTGRYVYDQLDYEVQAEFELFDFSAHAGMNGLYDFIDKVNPNKVVTVHGDETERFAEKLRAKGYEVYRPETGETLEL